MRVIYGCIRIRQTFLKHCMQLKTSSLFARIVSYTSKIFIQSTLRWSLHVLDAYLSMRTSNPGTKIFNRKTFFCSFSIVSVAVNDSRLCIFTATKKCFGKRLKISILKKANFVSTFNLCRYGENPIKPLYIFH